MNFTFLAIRRTINYAPRARMFSAASVDPSLAPNFDSRTEKKDLKDKKEDPYGEIVDEIDKAKVAGSRQADDSDSNPPRAGNTTPSRENPFKDSHNKADQPIRKGSDDQAHDEIGDEISAGRLSVPNDNKEPTAEIEPGTMDHQAAKIAGPREPVRRGRQQYVEPKLNPNANKQQYRNPSRTPNQDPRNVIRGGNRI
tara:strand:+ start:447 stop:1037 length:591 start_codon:yes stop_codon:yes gene_type:complete